MSHHPGPGPRPIRTHAPRTYPPERLEILTAPRAIAIDIAKSSRRNGAGRLWVSSGAHTHTRPHSHPHVMRIPGPRTPVLTVFSQEKLIEHIFDVTYRAPCSTLEDVF